MSTDTGKAALERSRTRIAGFSVPEMDFQLLRQLGSARYGGASVGECLALANQQPDATPAAWVEAFSQAGRRQDADAQQRERRGHAISARDQYLVACNSYRAAEYFSPIDAPAHRAHGLASRRAFLAAMRCGGQPCEELWFEHEGLRLPAYHVQASGGPRAAQATARLLLIVSGYDGTLEESYLAYGQAALERGYDLLLFTLPGQMDTWRFNEASIFVPDVERAARLVVDHALSIPGMRPGGLALMGLSFGGYFALRIAAHEPRLRALIANSPIPDLHAYMTAFVGQDPASWPPEQDFGPAELEAMPADAITPERRDMSYNLMRRFGQPSFIRSYQYLRQFRVDDEALRRIECPCLSLIGEGEGAVPLQLSTHFLDTVRGPAAHHLFTAEEGADGHGQVGNLAYSNGVALDWLDEQLQPV